MPSLNLNPTKLPNAAVDGAQDAAIGASKAARTSAQKVRATTNNLLGLFVISVLVSFAWREAFIEDGESVGVLDGVSILIVSYYLRRVL